MEVRRKGGKEWGDSVAENRERLTRYHSLKVILSPPNIILQRLSHNSQSPANTTLTPPTHIIKRRLPILQPIHIRHADTPLLERRDLQVNHPDIVHIPRAQEYRVFPGREAGWEE